MKKYLILTAMLFALAASGTAWSQSAPPSPPAGGNGGAFHGPNGEGGQGGERFEEHKAEMIRHIKEHIAEAEQRLHCVEAAANHEALRACMPERGEHGPAGQEHQGH